jgi:membrane protease YdiL (CAAX protease family)
MVQTGSGPPSTLSVTLAIVVTLAGIAAMLASMALTSPYIGSIGIRGVLVVSEAALLLPALLVVALRGMPPLPAFGVRTIPRRTVVLSLALGTSLWMASLGLLELQYSVWAPPEAYLDAFRHLHEMLRPRGPLDALYSLLAIALMPALCEEALLRGILLPSLRRRLAAPLAVILTALVFALIHDAYRMPFTFLVGLVLGALRLRAGSLLPSLIPHATLNALTFAVAPFLDDPSQPMPDPRPLLGLGLVVGGAIATALVWGRLPSATTSAKATPEDQAARLRA